MVHVNGTSVACVARPAVRDAYVTCVTNMVQAPWIHFELIFEVWRGIWTVFFMILEAQSEKSEVILAPKVGKNQKNVPPKEAKNILSFFFAPF